MASWTPQQAAVLRAAPGAECAECRAVQEKLVRARTLAARRLAMRARLSSASVWLALSRTRQRARGEAGLRAALASMAHR